MSAPNHHPKSGFARLFAVLLTVVFLASALPGPQGPMEVAAQTTTTPTVTVYKSDYQTPLDGASANPAAPAIYGLAAVAYVESRSSAHDTTNARDVITGVTVKSTKDGTGIGIDLLETGPATGVFRGAFGFTTAGSTQADPVPDLGRFDGLAKVSVANGNAITVQKVLSGSTATTTTFTWYAAETASGVTLSVIGGAAPRTGDQIRLHWIDPVVGGEDPPGSVRFYSNSTTSGIQVTPFATNPTKSDWQATVRIGSGAGELKAGKGDSVWAEYVEKHDATNQPQTHVAGPLAFTHATRGIVSATNPLPGSFDGSGTSGRMTIIVIDDDADKDQGLDLVDVEVKVDGGAPSTVRLQEQGGSTGIFIEEVRLAAPSDHGDCPSPCLAVTDGATLSIAYNDLLLPTGTAQPSAITRTWRESAQVGDASLTLADSDGVIVGSGPYRITLVDADRNVDHNSADHVQVRVKSTSDPASGVSVTLTESLPNNGWFNGTVGFTTGSSSGSNLKVANGDAVLVEYEDPTTKSGNTLLVRSNEGIPSIWRPVSTAEATAMLFTDQSDYYPSYDGDTLTTTVRIMVIDQDQNHPHARDEVTVTVNGAASREVTLEEAGVDSGVFIGTVSFGTGPTQLPPTTTSFSIDYLNLLPNGDTDLQTLTGLEFHRDLTQSQTPFAFVADERYGTPRVADALYLKATGDTTVKIGAFVSRSTAGQVDVQIRSTLCPTKTISLDADQTNSTHDGYYSRALTLKNDPSSCPAAANQLGVAPGDTVTITLAENGVQRTALARASAARELGTFAPDLTTPRTQVSGMNMTVFVRLVDVESNLLRGMRENRTLTLDTSRADTTLELVETGPDTGIFVGTFAFSSDPTDTSQRALVTLRDGLTTSGTVSNGYGIMDFVRVRIGSLSQTVQWFPASDTELIVKDAVGSSPFTITLKDDDGLPHRTSEDKTVADVTTFAFATTPYIGGSELVFVQDKATQTFTSPGTHVVTMAGTSATEPITDWNGDGLVDCRDVSATATRTSGSVGGGSSTSSTPVNCVSVDGPAGKVTVAFPSCSPSTSATSPVSCAATVQAAYRPVHHTVCPTSGATAFQYTRTAAGIALCAKADSGEGIRLQYTAANRAVVATSAAGETETVTLGWAGGSFVGELPVETTATSGNGKIRVSGTKTDVSFRHADLASAFDGRPGSHSAEHFRRVSTPATWTGTTTGSITLATQAFAPASGTHFGPTVPIMVTDPDADRSSAFDTVEVNVKRDATGALLAGSPFILFESGPRTGVFQGAFPATAPSGKLRVEYVDAATADGTTKTITKLVDWRPTLDAAVSIHSTTGALGGVLASDEKIVLRVVDGDSNKAVTNIDTVKVRLRTLDHAFEYTLSETGANSGTFQSMPIQPTRSVSSPALFKIADPLNDDFWMEYVDPAQADGVKRTVESARHKWDQRTTASVDLDRSAYTGTNKSNPFGHAQVTVIDPDRNTDPRSIQKIGSGLSVARANAGGSEAENVVLFETTPDSGVFVAPILFAAAADDSTVGIVAGSISTIEARFTDTEPASGSSTTATDEAAWYPDGHGFVQFDRDAYSSERNLVTVTLVDSDLTASSAVKAILGAEGTGDEVVLERKAGSDPFSGNHRDGKKAGISQGVYVATVSLAATGSATTDAILQVDTIDTIGARYADTTGTNPGDRTATAIVRADDSTAPVTEVVTDPAQANGFGWFQQQVLVSFEVDADDLKETRYSTVAPAASADLLTFGQRYTPGSDVGPLGQGVHELWVWSIDLLENIEDPQLYTVKVDTANPTATVSGLTATSAPEGVVRLAWTPCVKNEFDCFQFRIDRGGVQLNTTEESTFDDTPPSDGSHSYNVTVLDASGRAAATATQVVGVSDRVPPEFESVALDKTELFEEEGDDRVKVTAIITSATLADVANVTVEISDPFSSTSTLNLQREGTTRTWSGTFQSFNVSGTYAFKVQASDLAGNADTADHTVVYHAIDRSAPQVEMPATVTQGSPLTVTVRDNDAGIASIVYTLDDGNEVSVPVSGRILKHDFTIATTGLAKGTHTVSFSVSDLYDPPNVATYQRSFSVIEQSDDGDGGDGGTTPPSVAPGLEVVSTLIDAGGSFRFRASGSGLTALTVAFDGGTAQAVLSSWTNAATPVVVPVSLDAGAHTATVTATNAAGTSTEEFSFYVLDAGIPLPPETVVVIRQDGKPQVQWTASSGEVGGYLVHRASSPSKVIAVLGTDATEYLDRSAAAGKVYSYAVTAYGMNDEGKLANGAPSEDLPWFTHVRASSFTVDADEPGLSNLWWMVLILGAVIVAAGLVYANRERLFTRRDEDEAYDDEYPDEAGSLFAADQHHLRCPNCTHEFNVSGQKPIVTTCPNCGKKGILR